MRGKTGDKKLINKDDSYHPVAGRASSRTAPETSNFPQQLRVREDLLRLSRSIAAVVAFSALRVTMRLVASFGVLLGFPDATWLLLVPHQHFFNLFGLCQMAALLPIPFLRETLLIGKYIITAKVGVLRILLPIVPTLNTKLYLLSFLGNSRSGVVVFPAMMGHRRGKTKIF